MACRVGLIDDHPLYADALELLLSGAEDLVWVGAAATVDALLAKVARVELAILDLRLTDGSLPQENVARLHAHGAEVLVYTSGEHPVLLRSAAQAGVLGVVLKASPRADVLSAIRAAACGEPVLTAEWAAAVDSDPELYKVDLSLKQQQVLTRLAEGELVDTIARGLGISSETVKQHSQRIRLKYAEAQRPIRSPQDYVRRAMEDGLTPYPVLRKPLS
jgi:DNA-binding NarL/FixJ family response regulator